MEAAFGRSFCWGGVRLMTWGYSQRCPMAFFVTNTVPQPSTWAKMLLGFAGISFMAYGPAFNVA